MGKGGRYIYILKGTITIDGIRRFVMWGPVEKLKNIYTTKAYVEDGECNLERSSDSFLNVRGTEFSWPPVKIFWQKIFC